MAEPVVVAVSGVKNSGKTTLIERVLPLLCAKGLKVAVIKHDGHDFSPDVPGTDTFRHWNAGACGTAVFSAHKWMACKQGPTEETALMALFPDADLILLEGFKHSPWPKLELVREGNSTESVCQASTLLALVSALPLQAAVPVLHPDSLEDIAELLYRYYLERSSMMNENLAYQEVKSEELIGGNVVAMSPAATNHNRISGNIFGIFWTYLRRKKCVPFGDGESVFLTDRDEFIPDFMVVCDRDKIKSDGVHGAPDLVVEVLSPSTASRDRGYKKEIYAQCGVREYWIVSPGEKSVEQYWLEGGQLALHEVHAVYPDFTLARMTEEERAAVKTEFQCSLYDDLVISLDDIFSDML